MEAKIYLLCAGALALAIAGCTKSQKSEAEPTPEISVAEVASDTVLLSKSFPGTLSSTDVVDIVGRVNGYLLAQHFDNGAKVKKGQLLFSIEDTQYRDAVAQAEAALATANSQYDYASKNYKAMQIALESDAVSQIEVLDAKSAMEQAAAAIENAKAALETARTNLSYCKVYAPWDGTMGLSQFSPGAYIGGAASPVTLNTIYANAKMFANFYIEDASFLRMFSNENNRHMIDFDNVPIEFSEELPHKYYGKMIFMAPDVNTSTGTLHVRAVLDNTWDELRDGMYVTVVLPYKLDTNALLVKDSAISTSQTNKFLYVVNDSNQVVYKPIEIGQMANDSMRIVEKGLEPGEKYVTKALLKVRPGMSVKPILTK